MGWFSSTPRLVEPLGNIDWLLITIVFTFYCVALPVVTYFFIGRNHDYDETYTKWSHASYGILAAVLLIVPAWSLFRGYPGQWGGLWLLIPAIVGFIVAYVFCTRKGLYMATKDLPWTSFLGVLFVSIVCGGMDYVSERLASIPMSWGMFLLILVLVPLGIYSLANSDN